MNVVIMVAQVLLGLTILVFVHELGHFLAAKAFKTKVEKFYLFFDFLFPLPTVLNFALFKKKVGDTEYGFGWFPLGGYVSIAGMIDETTDESKLASVPQPWEYRSKKNWQKLIIILAGIIFNLIFAMMINFSLMKFHTKEYLPASELNNGGVLVSDYAKKLGFQNGDVIRKVNGEEPLRYEDLMPVSIAFGGEYEVERMENNQKITKKIQIPSNFYKQVDKYMFAPFYHHVTVVRVNSKSLAAKAGLMSADIIDSANGLKITHFDLFRQVLDSNKGKEISIIVKRKNESVRLLATVGQDGKLGFNPGFDFNLGQYHMVPYSIGQCIKYGVADCFKIFGQMGIGFMKMFSGEVKVNDGLGGPIEMADAYGSKWDWANFWFVTAMISVALAFGNLLPIPALDGGHALIILIEMITGRPVSNRVHQILQNVGTIILLTIMVFVIGNGIYKKMK